MQKVTPFLWFDNNAEEAADFYTSIFKDSKINNKTRYVEGGMGPKGSIMTVEFELEGQRFTALNGGPHFRFNEAVSFIVKCKTQKEIDYFWEKLSEGGSDQQCGWLKDKFGLSWQIVPENIAELLGYSDPEKTKRAMAALMQMKKLDIRALQEA